MANAGGLIDCGAESVKAAAAMATMTAAIATTSERWLLSDVLRTEAVRQPEPRGATRGGVHDRTTLNRAPVTSLGRQNSPRCVAPSRMDADGSRIQRPSRTQTVGWARTKVYRRSQKTLSKQFG